MPLLALEGETVRRQLEDVLRSPGFARNERLSRFLRFVVERHLEGRHEELKETVIGNGEAGVYLGAGTYGNRIGSTDPTLETVISSNTGNGIEIDGSHDNEVIGTLIGTNRLGLTDRGNGANGVLVTGGGYNNTIGGTDDNEANLIAFSAANGVSIASGSGNGILGNSIHSNTGLGIDLASGANNNQAAPVLTSVQAVTLGLEISGTLTSTPKKTFTIEFFANDVNEPSGRYFLGSQSVTTNSSGVASFTYLSPLPPGGASFFTATATDSKNNTSEFATVIS